MANRQGDVDLREAQVDLGLALLGFAWLGLAWLGLAWLGLAWLGLAWLGLAWLSHKLSIHRSLCKKKTKQDSQHCTYQERSRWSYHIQKKQPGPASSRRHRRTCHIEEALPVQYR
jgi:hypothetical protein